MAEIDCLDCGARMDMVDPPDTPGPITYECPECHLSTADDRWMILMKEDAPTAEEIVDELTGEEPDGTQGLDETLRDLFRDRETGK